MHQRDNNLYQQRHQRRLLDQQQYRCSHRELIHRRGHGYNGRDFRYYLYRQLRLRLTGIFIKNNNGESERERGHRQRDKPGLHRRYTNLYEQRH